MKRGLLAAIGAFGLTFAAIGEAQAGLITFTVDGADSYVNAQVTCNNCGTNITGQIVPYLSQTFQLGQGQQYQFGFFTVQVSGSGSASATVEAGLAFTQPVVGIVGDNGVAAWTTEVTDQGTFSSGTLTWAPIPEILLPDGSYVNVQFTDIDTSGQGDTSGVDAIVRVDFASAVPEPSTMAMVTFGLLAIGGLALLGDRRRRFF